MIARVQEEASYLVEAYGMSLKTAQGLAMLRDLWPLHDGPAHIVLADFNLEGHFLRGCISGIADGDTCSSEEIPAGHPVYAATSAVLQWMLDNTTEDERVGWYSQGRS